MSKHFNFYQCKSTEPKMTALKLLILCCGLSSFSEALQYECPEPEEIFPCYCEEDDGDPWVFCNHLSNPDQIDEAVKGLKGYRIYKMSFFMNRILNPIRSNTFRGLTVERLLFENSTIMLTPPQFEGLDQLHSIQLRAIFNKSNPIIPLELNHHQKLREILFEKNRITILPNNWLKSVPDSLRSITVEENTVITMEDQVFAKVKHLAFLVLESNRIVIIKRSMFPHPANDLRSLNLNNNRIRYLPSDIFSEMPALRIVEMADNRLTTLDADVWAGLVSQLTKLDILGNLLDCNSNLKWMYSNMQLPPILLGQCEEPEKLRKKFISQLKLSDLNKK